MNARGSRWALTAGVLLLGFVGVASALGPLLYGVSSTHPVGASLLEPGLGHPLGTDGIGRDVLALVLAGGLPTLLVAVIAGVGTIILAALVGVLAGWFGGAVEALLMRAVDVVMIVPKLPLLILVASYAQLGVLGVALIIAATSWAPSARVLRAQTLSLRRRPHLLAAQGFGAGTRYMVRRHLVPELALLLIAGTVSAAGRSVLMLAGLAFLGIGDPTQVNWGGTMRSALNAQALFFTNAWSWWLLPPALALATLLLGLTLAGIGLDTFVNPRMSRHATLDRVLADPTTEAA